MRLTAKSKRGFSGPGGFTASFMRLLNGASSRLLSHFFANLSDNLHSSDFTKLQNLILYIVNMAAICAYICTDIRG